MLLFSRLIAMVNTRATGYGNRANNTQRMDELREMMLTLVGAMHAQQQLLQQFFQHPQQQSANQHSGGGENQRRMNCL